MRALRLLFVRFDESPWTGYNVGELIYLAVEGVQESPGVTEAVSSFIWKAVAIPDGEARASSRLGLVPAARFAIRDSDGDDSASALLAAPCSLADEVGIWHSRITWIPKPGRA